MASYLGELPITTVFPECSSSVLFLSFFMRETHAMPKKVYRKPMDSPVLWGEVHCANDRPPYFRPNLRVDFILETDMEV